MSSNKRSHGSYSRPTSNMTLNMLPMLVYSVIFASTILSWIALRRLRLPSGSTNYAGIFKLLGDSLSSDLATDS
jgi:hypothetical protein